MPASDMNKTPAIEASGLTIGYRNRIVAEDVNFSIGRGEVVALLGRNGCGKSTLLRTLTGTQPALGGEVRLNGKLLGDITHREMARSVAVVVTDKGADTYLTAGETVELGRHPYTGFLGRLTEEDRRIVEESMQATGCLPLKDRETDTLSDGERQKVSIARALAQTTPVMLLDEPFSFIDVAARLELLSLLKRIAAEKQTTIIYSTHDVSQAFRYADTLLCFTTEGKVVCGKARELTEAGVPEKLFPAKDIVFDPRISDYVLKT